MNYANVNEGAGVAWQEMTRTTARPLMQKNKLRSELGVVLFGWLVLDKSLQLQTVNLPTLGGKPAKLHAETSLPERLRRGPTTTTATKDETEKSVTNHSVTHAAA